MSTRLIAVALLGLSSCSTPTTEEYTHPRDMGLPATGFTRPTPDLYQLRLPNELTAYVVEEHEVPLITMTAFVVGGGTAQDSVNGAAEALAAALRRGPATMSERAFADKLREMVAEYSVEMTPEMTQVSVNVPIEHAWEALDLLAEVLRNPNIAAVDLEALSTRPASASADNPYGTGLQSAAALFEDLVLAGHPYGRGPTTQEAQELSAEDVGDFHETFFIPGSVVLAVSGDFQADVARTAISNRFGDWPSAPQPRRREIPPLRSGFEREVHIYEMDSRQAWIAVGSEIPVVPPEEQAALEVMNYILGGGHFDTRLFREARDLRGLTNDASGFPAPGIWGPGVYPFLTSSRVEVVHELIDVVITELERIRAAPVSEEELFVAKGALTEGNYEMLFEDGHATAHTFALEWAQHGSHEPSDTYRERVEAVTAADVLAAATKYLHPERLQIVIIGPADVLDR